MKPSAALLLAALWIAAILAAGRDEPHGDWMTQGCASRVRVHPCKTAPDALCGTIAWLWEPVDRSGQPIRDANNGDAGLRERPLEGLEILTGLRKSEAGRWTGGSIYNPEDGRHYAANLRLRNAEVLELEGCVLFICKQQIWRRRGAGAGLRSPAAGAHPVGRADRRRRRTRAAAGARPHALDRPDHRGAGHHHCARTRPRVLARGPLAGARAAGGRELRPLHRGAQPRTPPARRYAGMLPLALVPALWFRVMNPRVPGVQSARRNPH